MSVSVLRCRRRLKFVDLLADPEDLSEDDWTEGGSAEMDPYARLLAGFVGCHDAFYYEYASAQVAFEHGWIPGFTTLASLRALCMAVGAKRAVAYLDLEVPNALALERAMGEIRCLVGYAEKTKR